MDRPLFRIFAAMLWMFWFTVLAPLHRRGILTVDGSQATLGVGTLPACCQHSGNSREGPKAPAERCAICAMLAVAGVDPPPLLVSLAPRESRFFPWHDISIPHDFAGVDCSHCRGPPQG